MPKKKKQLPHKYASNIFFPGLEEKLKGFEAENLEHVIRDIFPNKTKEKNENDPLKHSKDFSEVVYQNRRYLLTDRQAQVIKFMCEQKKLGVSTVSTTQLNEVLGTAVKLSLKEIFKKSDAWQSLIKPVEGKRGRYYLDI